MAAPTVKINAKTIRGKSKNQTTVKNVLFSPYTLEWPPLAIGETPKIMQEIQRTFEPYKVLPDMKKKKLGKTWGEKKWTPESLKQVEKAKKLKADLRTHIVFGVNATTKCLEKGHLCLVIVCRSAKPQLLTSHLMTLAACRGVPALAMSGLSETVAPMVRTRAVIAVGFKNAVNDETTEFSKLAKFIIARAPPIDLQWLQYKDVTLEELRQKAVEASNQQKQIREKKNQQNLARVPEQSVSPLSNETVQSSSSLLNKMTNEKEAGQTEPESLDSRNVSGLREKCPKECTDTDKPNRSLPVSSSMTDKAIRTSLKRTMTDAGLDCESSRKVGKVAHIPAQVVQIRSVPEQLKKEWKKKKNKKKKTR